MTPDDPTPPPAPEAEATHPPASPWARLRDLIVGAPDGTGARLAALEESIAADPAEPANYVLRGELYLELGEAALAQADFERGEHLAALLMERSAWGIIAQALVDRARIGLGRARTND